MVPPSPRRCAVILNPVKVSPQFREQADAILTAAGWTDVTWLETSEDDPGQGRAAEALDAGVDRVIVAGGDGTVRAVAEALSGSGVELGLVPAGTANLLGFNLGLPRTEEPALEVAAAGRPSDVDLVEVVVDGQRTQRFAVMAGTGLDAMIMDEVSGDLKKSIGTAAYFVAAGKALGRLPMKLRISVDGRRLKHRRAMMVLIGNVGRIPPSIDLIPGARHDDGLLDLMVASPRRISDWIKIVARMLIRRQRKDDALELRQGKRVEIELSEPDTYQLDGDVEGEFRTLSAEILPAALRVVLPADG